MPIQIQSTVNGLLPLTTSRNDARDGDLITLNAVGPATTWAWALVYSPQNANRVDSSAALAGVLNSSGPITFVVDFEGSYLVRLVVDLGLPSQQIVFVRIRYLTKFGKISLVAAGERKDDTKDPPNIPFDASNVGWANDQNFNVNNLLKYIQEVSTSGRIIYVDANRGKLNSNTPNTPAIAEGYANFSTITSAISAALVNPLYNGGVPPTIDSPIIIAVRPGLYEEDITFVPYVHVIAWPSTGSIKDNILDGDRSVTVRTTSAGVFTHTLSLPLVANYCVIRGINFVNNKVTMNAVLQKTGLGSAFFVDCKVSQESNDVTSGACVSVIQGGFFFTEGILQQKNLNADRLVLEVAPIALNSATVQVSDSDLYGPSVAVLNPNLSPSVFVTFLRSKLVQTGLAPLSFGVNSNATSFIFSWSEGYLQNGNPNFIRANPGAAGAPGDLFVGLYWSRLGQVTSAGSRQGIEFTTTGVVGSSILETGATEYSAITKVGVPPLTERAKVLGETIFFDNTVSGLTSSNVQDALDEIAAAALNPTLDDAYDNGRTIVVDADAVELHGPGVITNPPPLNSNNGDGTLRVYQQVEVGAIGSPEIGIYANNTGNGPSIEGGELNTNPDTIIGSSVSLLANTLPSFFNYNLRIAGKDAIGNNAVGSQAMGSVIIRGGTALTGSGLNAPIGGNLLLYAGGVEEALGGSPGNIWLSPGLTGAGVEGKLNLVDVSTTTPSTLTGANNFVDAAATPAGTITFSTVSGRVEVTFAGGENFALIQTLLSTGTGFSATWAGVGNPIVLTTSVKGGDAELLFIEDSTGGLLNTYLGDFSVGGGAIFVMGTFQDFVSLEATGDQVLTIGNGTNDLVYDAITGKLTVPGVIDPIALVFEEVDHVGNPDLNTTATQGLMFVSDGSGGLTAGQMYYRGPSNGTPSNVTATASDTSSFLTVNPEASLPNSKRVVGTAGQIGVGTVGSDFQLALLDTAVTPGTYNRAIVSVDSKGRVTSALNDPLVFDVGPIEIPLFAPTTITLYRVWTANFNSISALVWMEMGFVGVAAGDVTYDVLVRSQITNPGVFSSVIGGPKNIGTLGSNAVADVATDMGLKTGPSIIKFVITFNVKPAAGNGLMITLLAN